MAKPDSHVDQLRARIASTRDDLSANVEGLVSEVHPAALKRFVADEARDYASQTFGKARSAVFDESGPRWDRIGTAVLAVAGVVLVVGSLRGLGRVVRSRHSRG